MPKINVYLPEALAAAVRGARLSVSPICQRALAEAVRVAGGAREAAEAMRDPDFDPRQHPEISTRIASRMTPRLRQALRRAGDLAGPPDLAVTTHLLVGVIDEPGNLGVQLLQSLGVDVAALRDAAMKAGNAPDRKAVRRRSPSKKPRSTFGEEAGQRNDELLGGLSATARLTIAAALEAAIDLGHNFLGCEHLVLALANQADDAAAELLHDVGLEPDSIRRAIPATVAGAALGYTTARQLNAPNRLDDIDRRLDEVEERLNAGGL